MTHAELLQSLQNLKAGYISVLNELEIMKNWGKVQLEALYSTQIGKYEVEKLELQIELKAVKKKIQLAHQAINQGSYPDFETIESTVAALTREAYQEINVKKDKVAFGKAVLQNLASPEDSMELRKLFRQLAKNLHPDVNPNLTLDQRQIWHQFYGAYKTGDLDRFKALEIVYAETIAAASKKPEKLTDEQILLQTATLKAGILELSEQKKQLEADFPFNIADKLRDEDLIAEKQEALKKEIEEFKAVLTQKKADFALIKETYER